MDRFTKKEGQATHRHGLVQLSPGIYQNQTTIHILQNFYKIISTPDSFTSILSYLMNKINNTLLNQYDAYNPSPDSINQILLILQMDKNIQKLNQDDISKLTKLCHIHQCSPSTK